MDDAKKQDLEMVLGRFSTQYEIMRGTLIELRKLGLYHCNAVSFWTEEPELQIYTGLRDVYPGAIISGEPYPQYCEKTCGVRLFELAKDQTGGKE